MKMNRRGWSLTAILAACLLLAACAGTEAPKPAADQGPDYPAVLERWTAQARIYRDLDFIFQAAATCKSPSFRRAYVAKYSRDYLLDREKSDKMMADQMAMAGENIEFLLAVSAPDPRNADLKSKDSPWRVFLEGPAFGRLEPFEIRPLKKKTSELEEFFPYVSPWAALYTVRFLTPPGFQPGGSLDLVVTGVLGTARLTYNLED